MLEILPQVAFEFLLILTRIGAAFFIIPALGEKVIPRRVRVSLALVVSVAAFGFIAPMLPAMPDNPFHLTILLISEATIGIIIGGIARIAIGALHVTGTIIGFQGGLAAAQQFDPNQGSQGAMIASFLSLVGTLIVFAANLHHLLIASLINSYAVFDPGTSFAWQDFTQAGITAVANAFLMGVQLASPFIVYGLIYNVSLGLIARMMPQLPVFFVGLPLNVMIGFLILGLVMSTLMMWFAGYFEQQIRVLMP
jgi:flagellar biosynthesis protein FliR